jgi:RNA polymerase sigma factor (sigma-70 family)
VKRNPVALHHEIRTNKVMTAKRQTKARNLRPDFSPIARREEQASFQLTLLRAFQLPPACRDVFVLKDIQGYTLPEVAAALGITKDVVTKHLRRARREMQAG